MKTIRQIADEIGVSKTAVNKQIANLGLRSGLRKNGNQFAIDEHQEALIKQAFSEKSQTEIENQTQTKSQTENHEVSDLVCVLQATIDTLQKKMQRCRRKSPLPWIGYWRRKIWSFLKPETSISGRRTKN